MLQHSCNRPGIGNQDVNPWWQECMQFGPNLCGMGRKDGTGEVGEGRIDRNPADEGGSEGDVEYKGMIIWNNGE